MSFLIGTGIIWLLKALVVNPVTKALARSEKKRPQNVANQMTEVAEPEKPIDAGYYILVDVMVLGFAGFLLGLIFGWYFIGISVNVKGWPGMVAFIIGSLLGSARFV